MSGLIIARYSGSPPKNDDIGRAFGLKDPDYTYLVATGALEDDRAALASAVQKVADEPQLVFHKAMRHLMNRPLLTRAEERIMLQRAAKSVAQDEERERQLRHDVFAWRDALAELSQRGIDLEAGIPSHLQQEFANSEVGKLLRDLQRQFHFQQQNAQKPTFEKAAYTFLAQSYTPTRLVVMEGFTFLTPLQEHFLDVCLTRGVTVCVIHPYSDQQEYGYAVMNRTYERWLSNATFQTLPTWSRNKPNRSKLEVIRSNLFGDAPFAHKVEVKDIESGNGIPLDDPDQATSGDSDNPTSKSDPHIVLEAYHHRHREVETCIGRIQTLLTSGVEPSDIAIVVRDRAAYQSLLQEESQAQKLTNAAGQEVTLGVPPRMLLLTPLGRFALTLYQVWSGRQLSMEASQFETILASGWLGAHVQETQQQFSALKAQLFSNCTTKDHWSASLNRLQTMRTEIPISTRIPAAFVGPAPIRLWMEAIERIEALCRRLFDAPNQSIGMHIERLTDELSQLAPEVMRESEREVLQRIKQVLEELKQSTSLQVSVEEFGEILNSLVREYERPADEEDSRPVPQRIWLTSPEGIDSHQVRYVFYLGVDDQRVPRPYTQPWPFYLPNAVEAAERERYLFLAVVRAAQDQLSLSYSETDDEGQYGPSPYLDRIRELGMPLTRVSEGTLLSGTAATASSGVSVHGNLSGACSREFAS